MRPALDVSAVIRRLRGRLLFPANADADQADGTRPWSQMSQESQAMPLAGLDLSHLSDKERDAFEERAGIIEYDAHLPRAVAERLAFRDVVSRRG